MKLVERKCPRTIVFVIDGLRPDLISLEHTPCLWNLMKESVRFANSRAIFPTVTRVSAAAMGTGAYPGTSGIYGNCIYEPEIDKKHGVNTGTMENIEKLVKIRQGKIVRTKSMAERFQKKNLKYAAVSSGTQGSSYLLNPVAEKSCGTLVNGYFIRNERAAYPESISCEILEKFPEPEDETRPEQTFGKRVSWTEDVVKDYLIGEKDTDIIVNWIAEPDHSQHYYDVGSAKVMEMIELVDRKIEDVIAEVKRRGEYEETNFFILSDHGYSKCSYAMNVGEALIHAGIKENGESEDVIVVDNEETVLIHVQNREVKKVQEIVTYLQTQNWADVIFTAPAEGGERGKIPGTFSLDLIHLWNEKDAPDILVTFPWSSDKNEYGYPGLDYDAGKFVGKIDSPRSSHGSLSPYTIRNVMFALGPKFKRNVTSYVPVNLLDVAATILSMYEIEADEGVEGRVIEEMFQNGPDVEKIPVSTISYVVENAELEYKAVLQISQAGERDYLEKGFRVIKKEEQTERK